MNSLLVIEMKLLNELRYGIDRGRTRLYELCKEFVAEFEATRRETIPSQPPVHVPESEHDNVNV